MQDVRKPGKAGSNRILYWCIGLLVLLVVVVIAVHYLTKTGLWKKEEVQTVEPIVLTFYNADGEEDDWSDPVALAITEATGVTLETSYPAAGDEDAVALMIATGELTDLVYAKGDSNVLLEEGCLLDLSDLIDQYGPNIKKLYGDSYESLKDEDGAIYLLSSDGVMDQAVTTSGTAQLQWAVIQYCGYALPTTLEEYEDMIETYYSMHMSYGGKETIGLTICLEDDHWYSMLQEPAAYIADGSAQDGPWLRRSDGSIIYSVTSENQKEYFRWLNHMYNIGYLDPEFATQSYDEYLVKIAEGRVLGLLDPSYEYEDAEISLRSRDLEDRTYAGLNITMDEGTTSTLLQTRQMASGWGIGITTACEDPVRAIQFLDYLCSEEGQILMNWGIEGENYYYDANGLRRRYGKDIVSAETDLGYSKASGVGLHVYPFPSYGTGAKDSTGNYYSLVNADNATNQYNQYAKTYCKYLEVDSLTDLFDLGENTSSKVPLYSVLLSTDMDERLDALDDITKNGLVRCIICSPQDYDANWEALMTALEEAGVDELEAYMNEKMAE